MEGKKCLFAPFQIQDSTYYAFCHTSRAYIQQKQVLVFKGRKEGNILFNDALNIFYLRLYGVTHMVKNHSDSERGNPLPPHGLLFPINSSMGPPHEGSIRRPIAPRANALTAELHLAPSF